MVYDETSGAPEPVFQSTTHSFSDLKQCTMADLENVIKTSPAKSCELDPIPTFLLCEFLDQLLPFIHIMCNKSINLHRNTSFVSEEGDRNSEVEEEGDGFG